MNTYARIMLTLVVSMDTAPKRRATWARLAKTQNLKYGERSHEVLGPPMERSDEMRYPQYRN
jgi:hypothetical protein